MQSSSFDVYCCICATRTTEAYIHKTGEIATSAAKVEEK